MTNFPAWQPVDYDTAWAMFDDAFCFHPSMGAASWPAIEEPAGSIVYSTVPCADGSGLAEWTRQTVNFGIVWALADVIGLDEPLIALDWQHQAYHFWPHRNDTINPSEMLSVNRVVPVPDGDYYIFVNQRMTFGTFGHPWEQTLCVFGSELIHRLDPILSKILPVVRSGATLLLDGVGLSD